jgi:hypothetical protein
MNGLKVVRSGASSQNGVPVGMMFFMGSAMLLATAGDLRMLVRGGVCIRQWNSESIYPRLYSAPVFIQFSAYFP